MADFCRDCSISIFGDDSRDLADIGDNVGVLCECCGPIQVDINGTRTTTPHNGCRCREKNNVDSGSSNNRPDALNGDSD